MVYDPPDYPTDIPTQTGDDPNLPDRVDDLDWLYAARYNELKKEICAALIELGALPKGTYSDVAARLLAQASALFDADVNPIIEVTTDATHIKQPVTLVGSGRVENHIVIPARAFKLPGAKPAAFGEEGLYITLDFVHTSEKEAFGMSHIPFRWDPSTDIEVSIDWLCDDDASGGDVVWGVEYAATKDNETVTGATTTITQAFTGAGAGLLQRSIFTTKLLLGNLERDDILGFRLFRDHDAIGDTLDKTARFLFIHFHYVTNQIGQEI